MSEVYNYQEKFTWKTDQLDSRGAFAEPLTIADIQGGVTSGMENTAINKFNEALGKTGHWYRVNSVTTTITKLTSRLDWLPPSMWLQYGAWGRIWTIEGVTEVNFETDIKNPNVGLSPQTLTEILKELLQALILAIVSNPKLFLEFLIVIAFIILTAELHHSGGIVGLIGGQGITGQILGAVILLSAIGIGLYLLLGTKTGRQAGRRIVSYIPERRPSAPRKRRRKR